MLPGGDGRAAGAAEPKHYGTPLVEESRIVSPGMAGSVFNPVVWAEFRRWRALPVTYFGIVILTFFGIWYLYTAHDDLMAEIRRSTLGIGVLNPFMSYIEYMARLLARPSTILPLLMVWRAVVSFRADGFYRPFRTTFLTPGEFLWGVTAVPMVLAALILVVYTGVVLSPSIVRDYHAMPPQFRPAHPYLSALAILFEGGLNGAFVSFAVLYFGIRGRGRLLALVPVVCAILLVQSGHAYLYMKVGVISRFIESVPPLWAEYFGYWSTILPVPSAIATIVIDAPKSLVGPGRLLWPYAAAGIPKFFLCLLLWALARRHIERREEM